MLHNLNVLLIGGDKRYVEVIKQLSKHAVNLYLIGYDQLDIEGEKVMQTTLANVDFHSMDAIILPVTGTTLKGEIQPSFSNEKIILTKEMINETPAHCVIYTGVSNSYVDDITENRTLTRIFARDDVAILNSIPTAEAALQLAIEHTDRTVHDAKVCVLGFGRVGFTVARLFANVGAHVTVAVRNPADMARISALGMKPIHIHQLSSITPKTDIFINTVPHLVLHADDIKEMDAHTLIIDLASKPGGTDFQAAKSHGINALLSLGLPGKTAPKTAGNIIGNTIISSLREQYDS